MRTSDDTERRIETLRSQLGSQLGRFYPDIQRDALLAAVKPESPTFGALDYTEQRFENLLQFYDGSQRHTILKREHATRRNLLQEASHHSVLYFATYGVALEQEGQQLDSYLTLAVDGADEGYLRVADVFALNLKADFAILAACNTGRGRATGDGIQGLIRAFTFAGAASLLMSLWEVPQMETFGQMAEFHSHWQGNKKVSKAHALSMAQRQALERHRDQPRIWAGFVLFGEWQ